MAWLGLARPDLACFLLCVAWLGLAWLGLDWTGLHWIELDWSPPSHALMCPPTVFDSPCVPSTVARGLAIYRSELLVRLASAGSTPLSAASPKVSPKVVAPAEAVGALPAGTDARTSGDQRDRLTHTRLLVIDGPGHGCPLAARIEWRRRCEGAMEQAQPQPPPSPSHFTRHPSTLMAVCMSDGVGPTPAFTPVPSPSSLTSHPSPFTLTAA